MSMVEQWRPIPGYEGMYEVSDRGQVKSLARVVKTSRGSRNRRERLLTPVATRSGGYLVVNLHREGISSRHYIHRLVMESFVGPSDGLMVCHGNGKPSDNRLVNLRYDTAAANSQDMIRHGNSLKGGRHHKAKLTDSDIRDIRNLRAGGETYRSIAQRFNVTYGLIGQIIRGERWSHLL